MPCIALAILTGLLAAGPAQAVLCTSRANGNWNAAGTWNCGAGTSNGPPAVSDTVSVGHAVNITNSPITIGDGSTFSTELSVMSGGNLQFTGGNKTFTLNGGITINNGGTFGVSNAGGAREHSLTVSGNITNNGTLDFYSGGNDAVNMTITPPNTAIRTISGNGATTQFCRITVDSAGNDNTTDAANLVDVTATNFSFASDCRNSNAEAGLTIVDGTFRLSVGVTVTPFAYGPFNGVNGYEIPANGRFWINHSSAIVNFATGSSTTENMTLLGSGTANRGGKLQMTNGTFTLGNTRDARIRTGQNTAILLQSGNPSLTVSGRIHCVGALPGGDAVTYTQQSGTVRLATVGNSDAGGIPAFCIGSNGTFNMSGGTIIVERGSTSDSSGYINRAGTHAVSGGKVQIGAPGVGSGPGGPNQNTVLVESTAPVWNFEVNNDTLGLTAQLNVTALKACNEVRLTNGTLNAVSFGIDIGDTSCTAAGTGNWAHDSPAVFTAGTGTVRFLGAATATLGGTTATTFNHLTLQKSAAANTVTLASATLSPTVNGNLTLTTGRLVTFSPTTCSVPLILGLTGRTLSGSASSYVRGGVRKLYDNAGSSAIAFNAGADDEFPVGDAAGNYTPVNMDGGVNSTASGDLTVCVTPSQHGSLVYPPGTTGTVHADRGVNRYWTFENNGLNVASGTPITATFKFVSGDLDAAAPAVDTSIFIVERLNGALWFPTTAGMRTATSTQASNIILPVTTNAFVIGEPISGFTTTPGQFNAFDTSTPATAVLGKIQTKVVGTAFTIRVVAVNSTGTAVDTAFSGNVNFYLVDASSGGALDPTTKCNALWPTIYTHGTQPNIVSGGTIDVAGITVNGSYRDVRVKIVDVPPPAGPLTGCSTDRFAIRPQSLTASGHDATWETAGTTRTLNNSGPVHKASTGSGTLRPFTLRAIAVPATDTTYNGTPTVVATYPQCTGAVCAQTGTLTFTPGSWSGAGQARDNATAHYSEAGSFLLRLEDQSFADVDVVDGSSTAQRYVPATGSATIGKFVPDRFTFTTPSSAAFRTFNALDGSCGGGTPLRSFTYIGQPFWYATLPSATVNAVNGGGAITQNYSGADWGLIAGEISEGYTKADSGPALDLALTGTPTIVAGTGGAVGTGTYTADAAGKIAYTRNTTHPPVAANSPFSSDISLTVTAADAFTGAQTGTGPASISGTGSFSSIGFDGGTFAPTGVTGGKAFVFGTLKLRNAIGSEKLDLTVPLEAQYWTGTVFSKNTPDHCTQLTAGPPAAELSFTAYTGGLDGTSLPNSKITLPAPLNPPCTGPLAGRICAGDGRLVVTRPTGSVNGTATMEIDLSTATGEDLPWLLTRRTGATYSENPPARIAFGVYGTQPNNFIYLRENY